MSPILEGLHGWECGMHDRGSAEALRDTPSRAARFSLLELKVRSARSWLLAFLVAALAGVAGPANAEPTSIIVRAIAMDGKFIGSGMGLTSVLIRDEETGAILAEGRIEGGTGDTRTLIETPRTRGRRIAREGDAAFRTTIDLPEPRRLRVEISGPGGASAQSVRWVIPGRSPHGDDGWIVELAGLFVDLRTPSLYERTPRSANTLAIEANVALLCGCSIEPQGLWPAETVEVAYVVRRDGIHFSSGALSYAGAPSLFRGAFEIAGPGAYEVRVSAYDERTGNAGFAVGVFVVS